MNSDNGFGSFDILIVAADIKARGRRVGADKINIKLMLSVELLQHTATSTWLSINLMLILSTCLHPMEISPSNNISALTNLHDDKSITDEFPFSWHEVVSHYLKYWNYYFKSAVFNHYLNLFFFSRMIKTYVQIDVNWIPYPFLRIALRTSGPLMY